MIFSHVSHFRTTYKLISENYKVNYTDISIFAVREFESNVCLLRADPRSALKDEGRNGNWGTVTVLDRNEMARHIESLRASCFPSIPAHHPQLDKKLFYRDS